MLGLCAFIPTGRPVVVCQLSCACFVTAATVLICSRVNPFSPSIKLPMAPTQRSHAGASSQSATSGPCHFLPLALLPRRRMATFFLWASGANIPDRSSAQRMSRGPAPNAALNAVDNADAKSQENLQEILSTEAVVCFESDKLERVLLADAQTDSMALPSPPVIPQQRKP